MLFHYILMHHDTWNVFEYTRMPYTFQLVQFYLRVINMYVILIENKSLDDSQFTIDKILLALQSF